MEQKQYVFTIVIDGIGQDQKDVWFHTKTRLALDLMTKDMSDIVMDIQEFPVEPSTQKESNE